jgi:exopolysaccharide biosynthesis protein
MVRAKVSSISCQSSIAIAKSIQKRDFKYINEKIKYPDILKIETINKEKYNCFFSLKIDKKYHGNILINFDRVQRSEMDSLIHAIFL